MQFSKVQYLSLCLTIVTFLLISFHMYQESEKDLQILNIIPAFHKSPQENSARTADTGAAKYDIKSTELHTRTAGTEAAKYDIKSTELQPDIVKILDVVNKMENKKPLLVTLINNAYLPFTYSWLCNTKDMNVHKQVLLIATDFESEKNITKLWPNVKVVSISGFSAKGDQLYSHAGYVRLMIRRTQILLALLQHDIEIFLFEVDCLWLKNPVPVMSKQVDFDILVNPVSQRPGVFAGGFIYMFPTKATKILWYELNTKLFQLEKRIKSLPPGRPISEGQNDQIYFSGLIVNKFAGIKAKQLPLDEYPDGKWYVWSNQKRASLDPYIINNNWALGNQRKITRAKEWGHWFINTDNTCDMERLRRVVKTTSDPSRNMTGMQSHNTTSDKSRKNR